MEEQSQIKQQKAAKSTRWRRVVLIVCIVLFAFLVASYGLRSSLYLKARLTPKLAELGEKLDGRFEFNSIRAMGVTGLILDQVRFIPNQSNVKPLTFDSVTVYPALMGMFVGDLNASLVEINGMKARFNFNDENTPDVMWLKSLAEHAVSEQHNDVVTTGFIDGPPEQHAIPVLHCENCEIIADVAQGRTVKFNVSEHSAEIDNYEEISLSGTPVDVCVEGKSHNPSCFKLGVNSVRIGDSIAVSQVEISDFNYHGVQLESLLLQGLMVAHNEFRNVILVESGQVEGHIDDSSELDALAGDYLFEFTQLEMLHECEKNRLGLGVQLREPTGATARFYGGYSLNDNKLAVTFDTSKFDLARFVQKAEFSKWFRLDAFPVSGHVSTIVELDAQRAWFDVDASVSNGVVYSSALARDPISEINSQITMSAWIDLAKHTFSVDRAIGKIGKIPFEMSLSRSETADGSHQVDASLACSGDSAEFISSIPKGFAPMLSGYKLNGGYDFRIALSYDEANLDALLLNTEFNLDSVVTVAYDPRSDFNLLKGNAFKVQVNAATVPIAIGPRESSWVSFYDLPRETAYAFVASEDGKFFTHPGFDIRAIRASLIADIKADKVVRGGSTISQQVVKNLFLNHDKTASRKFQEAFLTWQMEKTLPKLRIFEIYLNLAHWAKDTYGIRAAAQYYFQKNVSQLTLRESLFLASILPNPIIFGRQYAEGKLSSSRLTKMINVGNALRQTNRIKADVWAQEEALIREGKISDRPKSIITAE